MDLYEHDEDLRRNGFPRIAGIDEAGRGPLAGPVVAAAVILKGEIRIKGLRDSKKVPEKERESLFSEIKNSVIDMGIGIVGPEDIDRLNILGATRLSMQLAVENLSTDSRSACHRRRIPAVSRHKTNFSNQGRECQRLCCSSFHHRKGHKRPSDDRVPRSVPAV